MEAVEGSAEAGSVKLRLENETDRKIIFDDSYEIQRFDGGYWCSVPYSIDSNAIVFACGICLDPPDLAADETSVYYIAGSGLPQGA